MKVILSTTISLVLMTTVVSAHDFWENGDPVPAWVKSWCCGVSDIHHIKPGAIHIMDDGYHIDGIHTVVPFNKALPSPDGTYWGFWNPTMEPDPVIYCFFTPVNGS